MVGAAGAIFSLLAVFVMAAAAKENETGIVAAQRSLVDLAQGGGANPLPRLAQLVPVFVATYLAALLTCLVSLGFSWYAGRLAAIVTGRRESGAVAGFWVALVSGSVWAAVAVLVILALRADGTASWLLATLLYSLTAPSSHLSGAINTQATPVYVGMQLALFLLQALVGGAAALGLGALAGRLGSEGHTTAVVPSVPGWAR